MEGGNTTSRERGVCKRKESEKDPLIPENNILN